VARLLAKKTTPLLKTVPRGKKKARHPSERLCGRRKSQRTSYVAAFQRRLQLEKKRRPPNATLSANKTFQQKTAARVGPTSGQWPRHPHLPPAPVRTRPNRPPSIHGTYGGPSVHPISDSALKKRPRKGQTRHAIDAWLARRGKLTTVGAPTPTRRWRREEMTAVIRIEKRKKIGP